VEAFDLADAGAVSAAIAAILARRGRLDILLNNAAVMPRGPLDQATLEAFDEAFQVNLRSAYVLCREAARPMVERRSGRIINVTSYVATVGRDGLHAYTVTKAGLAGLTRSLACELGPHNVTANAISPGFFLTDMAAAIRDDPAIRKVFEDSIALARAGRPEEIGGVAVFLASDASSFITGTTIDVDGGVANVRPMHVRFEST
jgi:gluconate 5-dehydrogenase